VSINDAVITESEKAEVQVQSIPGTKQSGTTSENKAAFDKYPDKLSEKHNKLITEIPGEFISKTDFNAAMESIEKDIDSQTITGPRGPKYGTTSTDAATTEKAVVCSGFILVTGAAVVVLFANDHTADSLSLNVNTTGAVAAKFKNGDVPSYLIKANTVHMFIYDGTYFRYVADGEQLSDDTLTVLGIASGTSINDVIKTIGTVPLDIQELYKPLIAPLSVSLSGFADKSYLYYGIPWDSELRVFVKVSKTTAMSVTTAIGTLPSGYRPAAAQTLTAYDSSGNAIPGVTVTIGTDGTVAVAGSVDANTVVMASYNSSESGGGGGV